MTKTEYRNPWSAVFALVAACAIAGCGGDGRSGDGNLSVLLEAEETIVDGIQAGTGDENILDGFDIEFSRYIATVGLVAMNQGNGSNAQTSTVVAVADFTSLGTPPPELTSFSGIPTGQYTEFGFETPAADSAVVNVNSVESSDVDAMIANGWSYIVEGTITRISDSASKEFRIEADVPAIYTNCALEGQEPGANVSRSSSATVTLHGDHIFFNGFPEEEGNVQRLAQWLWDIEDVNDDGVLSRPDFEAATDVGSLFPTPPEGVYELTGGPVSSIENAWDFVRAQLATQGHLNGEGECEWSPL